jgi:hypothetical protein
VRNFSKLSVSDRNSTTKSGQRGGNRFFSSLLKACQRASFTQAASGQRYAPLGNLNSVEESNTLPNLV